MSRHGIFNQTKVEGKKVQGVIKKCDLRLELFLRCLGASDQKSLKGWPPNQT